VVITVTHVEYFKSEHLDRLLLTTRSETSLLKSNIVIDKGLNRLVSTANIPK
jgi:hypothetical protein